MKPLEIDEVDEFGIPLDKKEKKKEEDAAQGFTATTDIAKIPVPIGMVRRKPKEDKK